MSGHTSVFLCISLPSAEAYIAYLWMHVKHFVKLNSANVYLREIHLITRTVLFDGGRSVYKIWPSRRQSLAGHFGEQLFETFTVW